jgi:hypothetical protein
MRKIHQDVLKWMLGGLKRRTAAHHEVQMAPCMIPRAMAAQIMEKVIEAANMMQFLSLPNPFRLHKGLGGRRL